MTGGPLDPLRGMTPARRAGGIWVCLVLAGIGMLLAGATACTDLAVKPARPGTSGHLAYIAALVLPVALALGVMAVLSHRRQVADPRSWGETWRELKIAALVGPPWLGFLLVGPLFGLGTAALTASSFFLAAPRVLMIFNLTVSRPDRQLFFSGGAVRSAESTPSGSPAYPGLGRFHPAGWLQLPVGGEL